ncbi:transposase family protein [Streptomyces sp. NBC_00076]
MPADYRKILAIVRAAVGPARLADLIRGHRKKIGSRWRALPAGKIAAIVLALLRCDQRPGDLAGGNGIHRTTVTRWVREVVGLLAARAWSGP